MLPTFQTLQIVDKPDQRPTRCFDANRYVFAREILLNAKLDSAGTISLGGGMVDEFVFRDTTHLIVDVRRPLSGIFDMRDTRSSCVSLNKNSMLVGMVTTFFPNGFAWLPDPTMNLPTITTIEDIRFEATGQPPKPALSVRLTHLPKRYADLEIGVVSTVEHIRGSLIRLSPGDPIPPTISRPGSDDALPATAAPIPAGTSSASASSSSSSSSAPPHDPASTSSALLPPLTVNAPSAGGDASARDQVAVVQDEGGFDGSSSGEGQARAQTDRTSAGPTFTPARTVTSGKRPMLRPVQSDLRYDYGDVDTPTETSEGAETSEPTGRRGRSPSSDIEFMGSRTAAEAAQRATPSSSRRVDGGQESQHPTKRAREG